MLCLHHPVVALSTWLDEWPERAALGRRAAEIGAAAGEWTRDRVEWADPGSERGVVQSLRSSEWEELCEVCRGRRDNGEGGG